MKYRNIKTGQIIDVPSEVGGKNWEKIGGKAPVKEPAVDTPAVDTSAVEEEIKPAKKTKRTKK